MRFFAYLDCTTNANGLTPIRFPSAGILKNISFQIVSEPTEVLDQDNWRVVLGDINRYNLQNSSPLTDDAFEVVQSAREKNMIMIQGIDFQGDGVGAGVVNNRLYFYHSSKTLRIRNDREYILGIFGKPTSNNFKVILMAEFYPYRNAYTKFKYLFDGLDDADNYQYNIVIPTGMTNVVLEYDAYVKDTEGTEIAARVSVRINPWNKIVNQNSSALITGKGVVDGSESIAGDIMYGGTVEDFLIGTAASGMGSHQGVIPVRNIIRAGDSITFDITNVTGDITNVEEFTMSVTVHGRATGEKVTTRSHFLDSNFVLQPMKEVFE